MKRSGILGCILPAAALSATSMIRAQVTVYNSGTTLTVTSGTTLTVGGSFQNTSGGAVNNQGTLTLSGDWQNDAGNAAFSTNAGTVSFQGTGAQTIAGTNSTAFYNLTVNKPSGDITLAVTTNVANVLNLSSGDIVLGSYNLVMGSGSSVSGTPGLASYVQADGSGVYRRDFNATQQVLFPVGDINDYSPFTFKLNSATFLGGDYITVRVTDVVHPTITPTDYITRYWTIDAGGFDDIAYEASYTYTDADVVGTEASMYAGFYNGTSWAAYAAVDAATNTFSTTSNVNAIPANHVFAGADEAALPVRLLYFSATPEADQVRLDWATAMETNSKSFTVQKSVDGNAFFDVVHVAAVGFSTTLTGYFATDAAPYPGTSYYRLKQVDLDGHTALSGIVVVTSNMDNLTTPISGPVMIYDATGRQVLTVNSSGMPMSDLVNATYMLPPGVYVMRTSSPAPARTMVFSLN